MGEGKLLSARDEPRKINSGRLHEEFSELIIDQVQLLSTLSSNTFTLCHAAALPPYPEMRHARKRRQWWQQVADTVVKGGVILRVKGEAVDVERGLHICSFASEIHKYAKSLVLDRRSTTPKSAKNRSTSPGIRLKCPQPARYAITSPARQPIPTRSGQRSISNGPRPKRPWVRTGSPWSPVKQGRSRDLRGPGQLTPAEEGSIRSHSDIGNTSNRSHLGSTRPMKREAWREPQEEDQWQYMRGLELQNPVSKKQNSR